MSSWGSIPLSTTLDRAGTRMRSKTWIPLVLSLALAYALLGQVNAAKFVLNSKFGQSCTQQLQCGTDGLLCLGEYCRYCTEGAECRSANNFMYQCKIGGVNSTALWLADPLLASANQTYGICAHKSLLKPLSWRDFLSGAVLFVGSCVAAGSGVGGGGLNVAILTFVEGFTSSKAIPLSSVMIGGAAIANFFYALPRQRLVAPRPLIDYHAALLLQPLTMGGSIIGILLNRLLPDWLVLLILIMIVGYTIYTMSIKFFKIWREDYAKNQALALASSVELKSIDNSAHSSSLTTSFELDVESNDEAIIGEDLTSEDASVGDQLQSPEHDSSPSGSIFEATKTNSIELDDDLAQENVQRTLLERAEQQIPWKKLLACFVILIAVNIHAVLIGGKNGPSLIGIRTCSPIYWTMVIGIFPILLGISWLISRQLVNLYHAKRMCSFQFLESDIEWTPKRTYATMVVAFCAGTLASLLGIGGGNITNPLLLELGVSPDATVATSSLMILFTSISAVTQYAILGRIQWDYALIFFVIGIFGSVVGQHILGKIVKKYKSQSYILLAMLIIIIPGGALLVTAATKSLVAGIKAGAGVGFKYLCTS